MATSIVSTPTTPTQNGEWANGLNLPAVDAALNLANGMTAGYGVNDGNITNPPPAPGQYGTWPKQPYRVGFIRNTIALSGTGGADPTTGFTDGLFNSPNDGLYTLYFMYNPNQVVANWVTNPNQTPPLYMYNTSQANANTTGGGAGTGNQVNLPGGQVNVPALANSQTLQWTLWFDRTYDMMYGNGDNGTVPQGSVPVSAGNPEYDRGVLKDVAALYNIMGTFTTEAAVPYSSPCEVVFGQNAAGQLWGFTGYLTGLQITYGIFRHDMLPSQCEIDLTMTCVYVPNTVVATSTYATGAAIVYNAKTNTYVWGPPGSGSPGGATKFG